jgi:hypothetical protein
MILDERNMAGAAIGAGFLAWTSSAYQIALSWAAGGLSRASHAATAFVRPEFGSMRARLQGQSLCG